MRLAPIVSLAAVVAALALPAAAHAAELRFPHTPAFVETLGPERPRAVVITMHGGGWYITGPEAAALERPQALGWAAVGWTVVNISYRPRHKALEDVLWFYDRVRRQVGRRTPICLAGSSAGGHLALMVAARRRDVHCVVARGAPTDLVSVHRHAAWGPQGPQRSGPAEVRRLAIQAFGRRGLRRMSPARQASRIRARVLLVAGRRDPLVARTQLTRLARELDDATVLHLPWGAMNWVHTSVSRDALAHAQRAEFELASAAYSSS